MIRQSFLRNYSLKKIHSAAALEKQKLNVYYAKNIRDIFKQQIQNNNLIKAKQNKKKQEVVYYRYTSPVDWNHKSQKQKQKIMSQEFYRGKPKTPLKRKEIKFTEKTLSNDNNKQITKFEDCLLNLCQEENYPITNIAIRQNTFRDRLERLTLSLTNKNTKYEQFKNPIRIKTKKISQNNTRHQDKHNKENIFFKNSYRLAIQKFKKKQQNIKPNSFNLQKSQFTFDQFEIESQRREQSKTPIQKSGKLRGSLIKRSSLNRTKIERSQQKEFTFQ